MIYTEWKPKAASGKGEYKRQQEICNFAIFDSFLKQLLA